MNCRDRDGGLNEQLLRGTCNLGTPPRAFSSVFVQSPAHPSPGRGCADDVPMQCTSVRLFRFKIRAESWWAMGWRDGVWLERAWNGFGACHTHGSFDLLAHGLSRREGKPSQRSVVFETRNEHCRVLDFVFISGHSLPHFGKMNLAVGPTALHGS